MAQVYYFTNATESPEQTNDDIEYSHTRLSLVE